MSEKHFKPSKLLESEYSQVSDFLRFLSYIRDRLLTIEKTRDDPKWYGHLDWVNSPRTEDDPIFFLRTTYRLFGEKILFKSPEIEDVSNFFNFFNMSSRRNEIEARVSYRLVEPLAVGFFINAIAPINCQYDIFAQTRPFNPIKDNALLLSGVENAMVYLLSLLGPSFIFRIISEINSVEISSELIDLGKTIVSDIEANSFYYTLVRDKDYDIMITHIWQKLEELYKA